ncbi:MAG: HD domain-containing protein [Christensenellales bacterium]
MTLVTQAVIFAAQAHDGAARKGSEIPYIVHPMEVAIASTMTDDPQVLAAAALHDVMEDCGVTFDALSERFGVRVAGLVCEESQRACGDPCLTWNARKLSAVKRICGGCRATKIIALSDKLSNMRAISRDFARNGEAVFQRFHQRDKRRHAWYYRSAARWGSGTSWRNRRMARAVRAGGAGVQRRESLAPDDSAAARRRTCGMSEFPNQKRETA